MQSRNCCSSENQLADIGQRLLATYPHKRVFAFYGEMGAGKTTFIKTLCQLLGVRDIVSSPTFSIVNEYLNEQGQSVFHFDFYRMKKPQEAFDLGYEEYLYSGNYCFIEWPEKLESLLPEDVVKVSIVEENNSRVIVF